MKMAKPPSQKSQENEIKRVNKRFIKRRESAAIE